MSPVGHLTDISRCLLFDRFQTSGHQPADYRKFMKTRARHRHHNCAAKQAIAHSFRSGRHIIVARWFDVLNKFSASRSQGFNFERRHQAAQGGKHEISFAARGFAATVAGFGASANAAGGCGPAGIAAPMAVSQSRSGRVNPAPVVNGGARVYPTASSGLTAAAARIDNGITDRAAADREARQSRSRGVCWRAACACHPCGSRRTEYPPSAKIDRALSVVVTATPVAAPAV